MDNKRKITQYEVYRLPTLDGGMVSSISNRILDHSRGFSAMLKNYDTSLLGLPIKRPGIAPAIETNVIPTGIHKFNQQSSGKEFVLISNRDKVHYLYEDAWTELVKDLEEDVPVYFLSIADQVIFSNGVDSMMAWNGADEVVSALGAEKATARTFLLYANNDLRFTAQTSGEKHIRVQYEKAPSKTSTTSAELSGSGTEDAPHLILVNLAWDDEKILSKASDVKSAIEGNSSTNAIIKVENTPESDGSREVTTMPEIALTGGYSEVKGLFLIEYRTRTVLAHENKLHLSHTGDPHLWSPWTVGSNAVEVFVGPDDGEEISGLLNMGDGGILIGKPNSLYGLFGYKRENFVIEMLDPTVGVSSHKSMIYTRPYAYWVWGSSVYCAQSGGTPERISFPIQEYLDEVVDTSRAGETTAVLYNRMYVVSFPKIGGGFITFCYHVDQEKWALWTAPQGVIDRTMDRDKLYFSLYNRKDIYHFDPDSFVDLPEDTRIETEIKTIELDLGLMEQEKDIGDLYLVFRGTGSDFLVDIDIYLDGEEKPTISLLDQKLSGRKGKQIVLRVVIGRTARFMEVAIKDIWEQQITPMALSYTYQIKDVV